jgi:hypothetical protein
VSVDIRLLDKQLPIVLPKHLHEEFYWKLRQSKPTGFIEFSGISWKASVLFFPYPQLLFSAFFLMQAVHQMLGQELLHLIPSQGARPHHRQVESPCCHHYHDHCPSCPYNHFVSLLLSPVVGIKATKTSLYFKSDDFV